MPIRIGTSEEGGTFHTQGLALKSILEREPLLAPVEVLTSPDASIGNAERLRRGVVDFGFMAANWAARARRGEAPFAGPIALSLAAPMNAGPLFFIARADSPLRAVADLAGRRVAVGAPGSGMAQHAQAILAALGLGDAVAPIHLDFAAGAAALADGAVEAQLQCPVPNAVMTALAERVALRVLSYGAAELERVLAAVPQYGTIVVRRGAIRGLERDLPQPAVINVLVTQARSDPAMVGAAARRIIADAGALARLNPLFSGLAGLIEPLRRADAAAEFAELPIHPGALKAFRDAGVPA